MCDCHSSRLQEGTTSLEIEMASESAIDFSSKIPSKGYDKKKKHTFKCKEDAEKHFKSSKRRATLQKRPTVIKPKDCVTKIHRKRKPRAGLCAGPRAAVCFEVPTCFTFLYSAQLSFTIYFFSLATVRQRLKSCK